MNFPKFWSKGEADGFEGWGWSDISADDAKDHGVETARRVAARFERGELNVPAARYGYADRPLREEVLREFRDKAGTVTGVITRNSYGCLVLNTAKLMFVDVDFAGPPATEGGFFGRLFGAKKAAAPANEAAQIAAMERAENWVQRNPGWGWRIYETRAGLRLMATHQFIDPADPICAAVFEAMNADPLYRRLCQNQQCYRARLTPKPWRCGIHEKPQRWPWKSERHEKSFRVWDKNYLAAAGKFATCRLAAEMGITVISPALASLIQIHDETTRAGSGLALA
jgi:hypothetical protein